MTLSTSAVAVCCWSDSRNSLSRRVFSDCNHCLVGKGRQQINLLVGKRPHLGSSHCHRADEYTLARKRHTEHGTPAAKLLCAFLPIRGIREHIVYVNQSLFEGNATNQGIRPGVKTRPRAYSSYSGEYPPQAAIRYVSPVRRKT